MKDLKAFRLVCVMAVFGCGAVGAAEEPAKGNTNPDMAAMHHAPAQLTDVQLIASAESAAPKALASGATIVVPNPDGSMRTLRKGTNGHTCMPDDPATPGPDQMCWDKPADAWVTAYMKHSPPAAGQVGLIYMLAGGTDASNTEPFATKPVDGHWIKTGPHIMIVGADAGFYSAYPKGPNPDTSRPYVMWAGTAYQNLMAPVK